MYIGARVHEGFNSRRLTFSKGGCRSGEVTKTDLTTPVEISEIPEEGEVRGESSPDIHGSWGTYDSRTTYTGASQLPYLNPLYIMHLHLFEYVYLTSSEVGHPDGAPVTNQRAIDAERSWCVNLFIVSSLVLIYSPPLSGRVTGLINAQLPSNSMPP